MQLVMFYLLKMLLCSAVLLGYYWVALRNERFHQWNRFYLLSAFFLSVVIPFFNIPLLAPEEPTPVLSFVGALPWNQAIVLKPAAFSWGWKETGVLLAALVSVLLLLHLLVSVVRIIRLYRSNTPTAFHEVSVVITEEQRAPFSFFRWLFWRSDIDPDTENGQRMLQHELTHISERHSADKLFVELLLIVCWMNPFFWFMRRELYAIHEFLADQKAIARYDGAAFASMILQAAHNSPTHKLSNPFFTSHLKRRLQMITNSRAPKYSYLRRISGLVLMVATAALLVVSIDRAYAQDKKKKVPPPTPVAPVSPATPVAPPDGQWTELPDSIKSAEVIDKKGVCYIQYNMKDGRRLLYELNEAKKKGYFIPPPPPPVPAPPAAPAPPAKQDKADDLAPASPADAHAPNAATDKASTPLYYFDGIRISEEHMKMIDPSTIATVNVWKGDKAIDKFGQDAQYGVVEIISKASTEVPSMVTPPASTQSLKAKATMTSLFQSASSESKHPLIILNDKEISEEDMKKLDPKSIMEIKVIKGADAFKQYGAKGMNGVIVIKEGC